jgi:hypothetical protein
MSGEILRKRKWFWVWQDEEEEKWLREMAQQGWHLQTMEIGGLYTFESGESRDDVYRLDFLSAYGKDMESYIQLFADAGWEHVGQLGSWQYFRTTAENGEAPEIYSEPESKIQKYSRVLLLLVSLFPIYFLLLVVMDTPETLFFDIVKIFFTLLILLFAYVEVRILRRISQLKKKL